MTPTVAPERERLNSVQVMRGIAALVVALYHSSLIMAHPEYGGLHAFARPTAPGWIGVNFFFVLSGFIILYAHQKDIGVPRRLPTYLWRRFSRVYPIYWIFLTLFVVAALAGFGQINFSNAPADMLTAYSLVQLKADPSIPLKVAWTLLFEVGFYAAFATLICHRRLGQAIFGLWLALILFNAFVRGNMAMGLGSIWGINFYFGMASYWMARRLPPAFGPPMLAVGIVLLLALAYIGRLPPTPGDAQLQPSIVVLLAVPLALILTGGVILDRHRRWQPGGALLLLGNASYALYLVHSAVISAVCILNRHFLPGVLPPEVLFCVIVLCAVAGGIAAHLAVEEPLLRLLRRVQVGGSRAKGRPDLPSQA